MRLIQCRNVCGLFFGVLFFQMELNRTGEMDKSQGMQADSRLYKSQGDKFSPKTSIRNAAVLAP